MRCVSILALIAALTHAPAAAPARPLAPARPAPGITSGMIAHALSIFLSDSREYVGLAVLCAIHGLAEIKATAFFGAFPGAHHPVQLAVRSPDGAVERFGPVLAGGPEAGFHSPQLRDPHDAQRFVTVALQPGALISNGYRSFWNRASEQRNQQVRDEFLACVQRPREKAATK